MRGSFKRRWITLIFAGWVPHDIGPSRGCLALGKLCTGACASKS